MKNVQLYIASSGALETLEFQETVRRQPGIGEIEVEVCAAGLNFKDVLIALGILGPQAAGLRLGHEFAGRVAAIGEGVTGVRRGDAVMGVASGSLARFVTVASDRSVAIPDGLTMAEGAGIPAAYLTAHYALECARLSKGETVLIHAATGGVGLAALALARAGGAEILATAGSEEKREHLRAMGIRHVMNSRTLAFADEVLTITGGRGVDVVVNSLAAEFQQRSFDILAPHGRFVELGVRDILQGGSLKLAACRNGATFTAIGSGAPFPRTAERLREIASRIASRELAPLPHRLFGPQDAKAAFDFMARARHIGKVVLEIRPGAGAERIQSASTTNNSISPCEGIEVFRRALGSRRIQVTISTRDLGARLAPRPIESPAPFVAGAPARHQRPNLSEAFVPPSTPLEEELAEHWQSFLGIESIGVNDDFFALGGDSLLAVQLLSRIRKAMAVDLPPHVLVEASTIRRLARQFPSQRTEPPRAGCLVRLKQGDSGMPPLFLVHPVGGQVYIYRDLTARMGDRVPIWGIKAEADAGAYSLEQLAARYLTAIRAIQPHGPYRLGGASFGGTLAVEIAQQLREAGEAIELLALIDAPAPVHTPSVDLDDSQISRYLLGSSAAIAPEELSDLLKLWRSNLRALREYRPRAYAGHAIFFRATTSDGFNRDDYHLGWAGLIPALEIHEIEGTHIAINLAPRVDAVAGVLNSRLQLLAFGAAAQ